jgi:hypothetical protein
MFYHLSHAPSSTKAKKQIEVKPSASKTDAGKKVILCC